MFIEIYSHINNTWW